VAAVPQLAWPAAPRTGPARRWLDQLGRRCCRCCRYCRYCGILFIAVVYIALYFIFIRFSMLFSFTCLPFLFLLFFFAHTFDIQDIVAEHA
jgi:hypothetical protein